MRTRVVGRGGLCREAQRLCERVWRDAKTPRNQLYVSRPLLKKLFDGKRAKVTHDTAIEQAVHRYGYSQREVADWLGLHYATVSRIANRP